MHAHPLLDAAARTPLRERRVIPRRSRALAALAIVLLGTLACASSGTSRSTNTPPAPATSSAPGTPAGLLSARPDAQWPVKMREHADLWLHGFALLQDDTTLVPFFRPGYRDQIKQAKARGNTVTQLDANHDRLRARFVAFPNLVNAQFIALYFGSWDELRRGVDLFLKADGNPRSTNDANAQRVIATLGGYFPTAQDREWVRLFTQSLEDEQTKFFHSYWTEAQRGRTAALGAVDSLWQAVYRPKMQRFLNNTRQPTGDFILSVPLDGEGRTITVGPALHIVAVGFPERAEDAREAIYAFAHEIVGAVANTAIEDNTTPAEKRAGVPNKYSSNALVRGGAMLLQRVAPDLLDGYARYYLRAARATVSGDPVAQLATVFPLPDVLRESIGKQIDVVLGGI